MTKSEPAPVRLLDNGTVIDGDGSIVVRLVYASDDVKRRLLEVLLIDAEYRQWCGT